MPRPLRPRWWLLLLTFLLTLPARGETPRTDRHGDPLPAGAVARLGTVRWRHGAFAVAFSRDGKTLASGGSKSIRLWEVATGKLLRRFDTAGKSEVWALTYSSGGQLLALEERESGVGLYEVIEGKKVWQRDGDGTVRGALSLPGKTAALVNGNLIGIQLWDAGSGKKLREVGNRETLTVRVALSPDGKVLASCDWDKGKGNCIRLWEVATGRELRRLPVDRGAAYAVAFSPDGKSLAVVHGTAVEKVLNTEGEASDPRDVALTLRDAATGKELRVLRRGGPLWGSLAFSPDGKLLALGLPGEAIHLLDVTTGKEPSRPAGHEAAVEVVAFRPDGKAVVSAGRDNTIRVWEAAGGKQLRERETPVIDFYAMAFSPDGKLAAVIDNKDKPLHLLDTASAREVPNFPRGKKVYCLAFSPDGGTLVAWGGLGPGQQIGELYFWDTTTGKERIRWRRKQPSVMAFSPDGKILALGDYDRIQLSEVPGGQELRRWDLGEGVVSLVFSPDGKLVASSCRDHTVRLWEVATGKDVGWRIKHPPRDPRLSAGPCTAFSPDGKLLVSGGYDATVRLWDVATARELHRFTGHEGDVNSVAFSPSGKVVASASDDTTVLVWDVAGSAEGRQSRGTPLSARELDTVWADLGGEDAARAYRAVWKLAAVPRQAVPFLGDRLRPAKPVDPQRVGRLIAELESDRFAVREAAAAELEKLGGRAVPALRKALAGRPRGELRRRAERLLEKVNRLTAERLRVLRGVQVLEYAGIPEARAVLKTLAGGAEEATLTREAKAALTRLNRRPGPVP